MQCTIRKCVRQGQRTDETQLTLSHNLRPVHRLPIGRTWQWWGRGGLWYQVKCSQIFKNFLLYHNLWPVQCLPIGRRWQWRGGGGGFLTIFTLQTRFCRWVERGLVDCLTFYYLSHNLQPVYRLFIGRTWQWCGGGGEEDLKKIIFRPDSADKSKGDELATFYHLTISGQSTACLLEIHEKMKVWIQTSHTWFCR